MWTKLFCLLILLAGFPAFSHDDHDDSGNVEHHLKKKTRLYTYGFGAWGSMEVPAGFTLRNVTSYFEDFKDGKRYGAGGGLGFPEVVATLEKDGIKRVVRFTPFWDEVPGGLELSDKKLSQFIDKKCVGDNILRRGAFEFSGGVGCYAYRKQTKSPEPEIDQYRKGIMVVGPECVGGGTYTERDPVTGQAVDPKDWKFEQIGDEIVRSFQCEVEKKSPKKKQKR